MFGAATIVLLMLCGCSVDSLGLAQVDVLDAADAKIVTVVTVGLHIDTEPRQIAMSLGYSRAVRVLPAGSSPRAGHYVFGVALPDTSPVVLYRMSYGVILDAGADTVGLSVGARESMRVAADDPACHAFRFDPARLEQTQLAIAQGGTMCLPSDG